MRNIEETCHNTWRCMMHRGNTRYTTIYSRKNNPSYRDCHVCEEWQEYPVFREWFMKNYIDGYTLDKDLFGDGKKIYSPITCCFLPTAINTLLITRQTKKSELPTGVTLSKNKLMYQVRAKYRGKPHRVGEFKNLTDAYNAYVNYKENYIREIASEYYQQGKLSERIYKRLMVFHIQREDFTDNTLPTQLLNKIVYQCTATGEILNRFDSIGQAAKSCVGKTFECARNAISQCCHNKSKTYNGYIWCFENEYKTKFQ